MTRIAKIAACFAVLSFAAVPALAEETLGGGKDSQMKGGGNKASGGMEKNGSMSSGSTSSDGSSGAAKSSGTTLGGDQKDNTGK